MRMEAISLSSASDDFNNFILSLIGLDSFTPTDELIISELISANGI